MDDIMAVPAHETARRKAEQKIEEAIREYYEDAGFPIRGITVDWSNTFGMWSFRGVKLDIRSFWDI